MNSVNRSRLIGLIHMQKKAAGITDYEYRAIIHSATGKESCGNCDPKELFTVFNDLNTLLEQKGRNRFFFHKLPETKGTFAFEDAIIAKAKNVLGSDWHKRLTGYLKKINKNTLAECSGKEKRQIMGWLSSTARKENDV